MAEELSPTAACPRLCLAVREAMTSAEVAAEMEWSPGKVIRIESGDVFLSLLVRGRSTEDSGATVLYRENGPTDEVVEAAATTRRYHRRFDTIWQDADGEGDTITFMRRRIAVLEHRIGGPGSA